VTVTEEPFRLNDAPMAKDRTAGWRYVRAAGDVVQTAEGMWLLISPEAVQFAHRHPDLFSSARAFDGLGSPVPLIPIAVDPPDHSRYRRVLDPMLSPKVVAAMEEGLREQARELIRAFADRGECDAIADLARLYPTQVFLTLFGMPLSDRDKFIFWAETIIETSSSNVAEEPDPEVAQCAMELFGYLQAYIDKKRDEPGEDMLSRILAMDGDSAWSNEEVLGLCFLFVLAGLDTVTAMIGFALYHLSRNAELRQNLTADLSLSTQVVEEILRLEPAAPMNPRVTTADVEVCGTVIPANSPVLLCIATLNRDPSLFSGGNEIDLNTADNGHRGFGGGIHRCLGSHLARQELRIVVEEFHKLIPDYRLAPGAEPAIVWPSGTFHLTSLPLVFPAASG
jgi:cytochrome P450